MSPSDQELLADYVGTGSESAFRQLVDRHGALVFQAAMRVTRRHDLAEDAAQWVFAIFTRKAPSLLKHPILVGWLHKTAILEAHRAMRKEISHQKKLRRFADDPSHSTPNASLDGSASASSLDHAQLDEALASLNPSDRQFLLLRFYEGYQIQEIAKLIGKTHEAARKQSERALRRLGRALRKRGAMASPAASLAGVLAASLGRSESAAAPNALLHGALAGSTLPAEPTSLALTLNTIQTMTYGKQLTIATASIALLAAFPLTLQQREISALKNQLAHWTSLEGDREENQTQPSTRSVLDKNRRRSELSRALSMTVIPLREATLVEMGYRMAKSDLEEALETFKTLEEAVDRREFLKGVFTYAAEAYPPRQVLDLAKTLPDIDRRVALFATISSWTSGRSIESGNAERFSERYGLEAGLGMALVIDESYRAELGEAWAESFSDIAGRAAMVGAFATAHLPANPDSALEMSATLNGFDREIFHRILVDNWAQKDPAAAWDWLHENLNHLDTNTEAVITEVLADLARTDLPTAEAALTKLELPHQRHHAISGIARALSYHHGTETAVRWANELSNDEETDIAHQMITQYAPKGIGAALKIEEGFPEITNLIAHSAAERDGRLQVGDRIVAVDSGKGQFELVYGRPMTDTLNLIHGDVGSVVKLRLLQQDESGSYSEAIVELERQQLVLPGAAELPSSGS